MIETTCHCGAVRLAIVEKPESITECNCSICRRIGALWGYYTNETARALYVEQDVGRYLWNDREIEFLHCRGCGCLTHYEAHDKTGSYRVAVNMRMFMPECIEDSVVRKFDGASM